MKNLKRGCNKLSHFQLKMLEYLAQPVIQQLNDKSESKSTLILVSQKTFNHRIIVAISSATHTLHRFTLQHLYPFRRAIQYTLVAVNNRAFCRFKNCSVQLVARNRECPKGLNNVPCVIRSCIKMHATRGK